MQSHFSALKPKPVCENTRGCAIAYIVSLSLKRVLGIGTAYKYYNFHQKYNYVLVYNM